VLGEVDVPDCIPMILVVSAVVVNKLKEMMYVPLGMENVPVPSVYVRPEILFTVNASK
jgi:hypothetical protein